MSEGKSDLQRAQKKVEALLAKLNGKIEALGGCSKDLSDELSSIQWLFDQIRNVPETRRLEYEKVKAQGQAWKLRAEKIEADYQAESAKVAGGGAAGVGGGIAFAALAPTAAMGFATAFGVASTGTAISALGGAAATNAALAWLGGGALAAGGGGMAAGHALLALAGPVGWAIAAVAVGASAAIIYSMKERKAKLENLLLLICKRDEKAHQLAIVELDERMARMKDETQKLQEAIRRVKAFGLDYAAMSESQQYELGSYYNLHLAATQLLINPILGLQPNYGEADLKAYNQAHQPVRGEKQRDLVLWLANYLAKITVDEEGLELLWEAFAGDEKFRALFGIAKGEFSSSVAKTAYEAWQYKVATNRAAYLAQPGG